MKPYQLTLEGHAKPATGHPIRDQLAGIMEAEPKTQADEDLLAIRWLAIHHTRLVYEVRASQLREIVSTLRRADIRRRRQELAASGEYPWPDDEAKRRQKRSKGGPPKG